MNFKCPNCAAPMDGEPGAEIECVQCNFRTTVPVAPPPEQATAAPAPVVRQPAMWAYLCSLVAIGTFFLAAIGIPFLLGMIGIGLGFWSHTQDRSDRRGFVAVVVGLVALVASAVFLAVG